MLSLALNQLATITSQGSIDDWGAVTPGATATVHCRLQPTTRSVQLPDGTLTTLRALCYVNASTPIALTDTLTIASTDYTPVQVDEYPGLDGQTVYRRILLV